ncbi:unnamed protein product [Cylicocyclus nassatus]|uniref:Uncharacterized protein n=1 Tax=Cylicocyclus nassatus TaxID=53992 RepID=A0AA36MEM6_CYLNA|nr:unnamed protein product [Cylicocyclus nassatus]
MEGRYAHRNPPQSGVGDKSNEDKHSSAGREKNNNESSKQHHGNQESKTAKENLQADVSRDPTKESEGGAHAREGVKQDVRYGQSMKNKDEGGDR